MSTATLGSVLSIAIGRFGFAPLRLEILPVRLVWHAASFFDLASRLVQKSLKLRRMREHDAFQFVIPKIVDMTFIMAIKLT